MKLIPIFAIALGFLTGCTFTAGYVSPNTGITYGLTHTFDGKTVKRLKGK